MKKETSILSFYYPILFFVLSVCFFADLYSQPFNNQNLENTHSLCLPAWGPYMKRYNGISHVPELSSGMRFDFSIHPAYYLRKKAFPSSIDYESGYHMWESSADLSYYSVRYDLEWKDKVYMDVSFILVDSSSSLLRYEIVNNTSLPQDICVNAFANINYPSLKPYSLLPIIPSRVLLPANSRWIDDTDYSSLSYANKMPQFNLVYDGQQLGIAREDSAVGGTVLGRCAWQSYDFAKDVGDNVIFPIKIDARILNPVLVIRYRFMTGSDVKLKLSGVANELIKVHGDNRFRTITIPISNRQAASLSILSEGGDAVQIDGLVIVEESKLSELYFSPKVFHYTPQRTEIDSRSLYLKYSDVNNGYGIKFINASFDEREFLMSEVEEELRENTLANKYNKQLYNSPVFIGNNDGHYTNMFVHPLIVQAQQKKVFYSVLAYGDEKTVRSKLSLFNKVELCEATYIKARSKVLDQKYNTGGACYAFSQQVMASVMLTNVVYPVSTMNTYILHNTPGRKWDCLYTWDNGFISLGLADLNINRSIECVNAYTMKSTDQSAFMHHGTPLPIQIYTVLELWNKTQDVELIKYFYPRLKRYYDFLAGAESSSTRSFKSNLLCTWDYFYNSGGWDDYPPQFYVHKNKLEAQVLPIVNTAHAIRTAKILKMFANSLGLKADISKYDADIALFSNAIQNNAWDAKSGYYGYVKHNEKKEAIGILKDEANVNFNMGLDGCYPLVAGITNLVQTDSLLRNLFTDGRIWCKLGLSTVDQRAPYYSSAGYWNGSVWMPHQWFFWKSMFDLGLNDYALRIAKTGLDVWKQEVDETYNCYEVFRLESARGAGWHQFGGLSAPVINWYSSMYKPGTITAGFDLLIKKKVFNDDFSSVKINAQNFNTTSKSQILWICLSDEYKYKLNSSSKNISMETVLPGLLCVRMNNYLKAIDIQIVQID